MDAYDWSTGVYATAVAMAKCMTTEELSRTAILLTQLGTTLGTLALSNMWQKLAALKKILDKKGSPVS